MSDPYIVPLDELIASIVLQLEAIVRILVRKGITTENEILVGRKY